WQSSGYFDLFSQFLGNATSYTGAPAWEIERTKDGLDVDVWHDKGSNNYDGSFKFVIAAAPSGSSTATLTTDWSKGSSLLTFGNVSKLIPENPTTKSSDTSTLVVGVSDRGSGISLALTVKQVCITLE